VPSSRHRSTTTSLLQRELPDAPPVQRHAPVEQESPDSPDAALAAFGGLSSKSYSVSL
jgi:hypothetical protein